MAGSALFDELLVCGFSQGNEPSFFRIVGDNFARFEMINPGVNADLAGRQRLENFRTGIELN